MELLIQDKSLYNLLSSNTEDETQKDKTKKRDGCGDETRTEQQFIVNFGLYLVLFTDSQVRARVPVNQIKHH